jgi:hypothetical protein
LALVFVTKMITAALMTRRAFRLGVLSLRWITTYVLAWVMGTGLVLLLLWLIVPSTGWPKPILLCLALFTMPALRLAAAPHLLSANRHGRLY